MGGPVAEVEEEKKKELGGLEKGKGRKKDGRLYNLWLSQQTISPLFLCLGWGGEGERRQRAEEQPERCSFMALVIRMKARRVHESARSPSTTGRPLGLPAPFSPERRAPQGAIRA